MPYTRGKYTNIGFMASQTIKNFSLPELVNPRDELFGFPAKNGIFCKIVL
jgi:hypothetical protein